MKIPSKKKNVQKKDLIVVLIVAVYHGLEGWVTGA